MAVFTYPKIIWNSITLSISLPLDNATAYSKMRDGYETVGVTSGEESAWSYGYDYMLEGDIRRIHRGSGDVTDVNGHASTCWDGTTGWRAFLEYSALKNTFAWYPDATSGTNYTCYLVSPLVDGAGVMLENNGLRKLHLIIRNTASAFDGY